MLNFSSSLQTPVKIKNLVFLLCIQFFPSGIPVGGAAGGGGEGSDEDTTSSESEDEYAKPSNTLVVPAAATILPGKLVVIVSMKTQYYCYNVILCDVY